MKLTNKYLKAALVMLALITGVFIIGNSTARAQHGQSSVVMSNYFNMVFSGDLTGAAALFEEHPEDMGTKMLKDQFEARFVDRTSGLDFSRLKVPKAREIAELFQAYWRDGLMQVASLVDLNDALKSNLDAILRSEGIESDLEDEDELWDNVEQYFLDQGYFALSGRTPPFYELSIWMQNDTTMETIELTDGTIEAPLIAISDFVSHGWMNFSAFGMTSMGGWAEADAIYCQCEHYDKGSEKFRLSIFKHEGRHYKDKELYPELKAPDMEYRGKLTELVYSEETTHDLMAQFAGAANKIDNAPHPLANWYVTEGISKALPEDTRPTDLAQWKNVPAEDIRQAAFALLDEHDRELQRQGGVTAEGIIKP